MLVIRRKVTDYSVRFTRELISESRSCNTHRNVSTGVRSLQRKDIGLKGWALLLVPITTFGLGTWQVQRRKWKMNLIQDLERRIHSEPMEFPEEISELNDFEYYPVRVRGQFDHSKELFLGPRTLIKDGDAASESSLISRNAKSCTGYCVITPFHLADKNLTILVNRGWIPHNQRNVDTRQVGQIEDEVEFVGIVRLVEKRPPFAPQNKGKMWFYRDLVKMAESTDSSPVLLDATFDSSIPGGPLGGQTRVSLRNEHFSYILTWYSLSAITSFMWFRMFLIR